MIQAATGIFGPGLRRLANSRQGQVSPANGSQSRNRLYRRPPCLLFSGRPQSTKDMSRSEWLNQ